MICEGLDYHPNGNVLRCEQEASIEVDGRWYCWLHDKAHGRQLSWADVGEAETEETDELRRTLERIGVDPAEIGMEEEE